MKTASQIVQEEREQMQELEVLRCVVSGGKAYTWHSFSNADLKLRLGELTAQEIRTLRAVLEAIVTP